MKHSQLQCDTRLMTAREKKKFTRTRKKNTNKLLYASSVKVSAMHACA